jgi:uncharacterized membrane protein
MGPEDLSQPNRSPDKEASVGSELRSLTARVEALERLLAEMRPGAVPAEKVSLPEAPPLPPLEPPLFTASQGPREQASASAPSPSFENRLGAQVFNRIGIIALMIGVTWFLKLAIDSQWIGPVGRILIGLVAGAGTILWSEQFRRKGFPAFSYSLKAIGTGVLYLSLWAAQQLYHLLPPSAALAGMILVTAWNAYMAWAQNAELLAAYALAGGLATPLLLSTGGNHEIFLFTYLLMIDAATVALVKLKSWNRLLLGAFPATVLYFIVWYIGFYAEPAFAITTIFVGLFFFLFACVPLAQRTESISLNHRKPFNRFIASLLLPLGDAAFGSLALYSVMQDAGRHWFLPWLMLIFAAVYLMIARLPQSALSAAIHLSLAVVFLTIAIPLKASGHWITVAWLVEGVALLWVAIRIFSSHAAEDTSLSDAFDTVNVLRWLSAGSLILGLGGVIALPFWFDQQVAPSFFNRNLATAVTAALAFAASCWLALRARGIDRAGWQWSRFAFAAAAAIDLVAVLLSVREILNLGYGGPPHSPFLNADFGMALMGLGILSVVAWVSLRIALTDEASLLWAQLSAGSVITINFVALLTGVREIESLWPITVANPESELQRALAVSAFLMIYGAVLLAAGFWKRSSFIRWQALILLFFTIGKTFLYDMRNLSKGYRVVSFLGLGALLMAVSFAYQKDWLALKEQGTKPRSETAGSSQ